jgi:hypothetical protein
MLLELVIYRLLNNFQSSLCPANEEFEAQLQENGYAARNWGSSIKSDNNRISRE